MFDEFCWPVSHGGHAWIAGPAKGGWVLVERCPGGGLCDERFPLREQTALFRVFAATEPTRDAVLQFANRHGMLGLGEPIEQTRADGRKVLARAEPLQAWADAIFGLRRMLTLWDAARRSDTATLARHVAWDGPSVRYDSHPGQKPGKAREPIQRALIASSGHRPELFRRFQPGDVIEPARFYVQEVVNRHLEQRTHSRVLFDGTRFVLHVLPADLLGAIWFQFARAIAGNLDFRQCEACGTPFELSPSVNRADRTFCSDSCRAKAYRQRKERARQLHAAGKSAAAIARELGSDTATIKRWLHAKG